MADGKKKIENIYMDFLRYCLDDRLLLRESTKSIDWMQMMAWAEQQAIVGTIYGGILRGGKALNVPFDALMEWVGYASQIESQNRVLNNKCIEIVNEYKKSGFECVILKGQGNAAMYPDPQLRTPGDIDLLVTNKTRQDITRFVRQKKNLTGLHYHHVEYEDAGISVEVHFFACSVNNPVYRRRLNDWLGKKEEVILADLPDGVGQIPVPTREFNVVFQLAHMMHHYFDEGIGLRQFVDYYYLLRSIGKGKLIIDDLTATLRHLNLYNFARAVMYIEKETLGLEGKYLIVEPDEKRGKTLLREILEGGNFGRSSNLDQHSAARKYFQKTWRNLRLAREYPAEALCEPFFRTWHFFWRLAH